jgi:NAD(P)-dependent dehydrogenase (short-subunit alcohol dehydrogenase family)
MLKNKVIIVTGGAGLIGSQFIKAIVENGGIAILADINTFALSESKEKLGQEIQLDNVEFISLDINSKKSINSMIEKVHERYGRIDAIVNNAYPRNESYGAHFFAVDHSSFCENVSLNLGGNFLVSQQLANYFKTQGYGNIINIASIYGVISPKFEIYENTSMTMPVEYAAIKAAMIHLTKYMAKYFKGMNIRVNSLSPGGVFSDQPFEFLESYRKQCLNKGMLDKSDLCGTLIYLLSDMSLCLNGQNIIVDDGFSI